MRSFLNGCSVKAGAARATDSTRSQRGLGHCERNDFHRREHVAGADDGGVRQRGERQRFVDEVDAIDAVGS